MKIKEIFKQKIILIVMFLYFTSSCNAASLLNDINSNTASMSIDDNFFSSESRRRPSRANSATGIHQFTNGKKRYLNKFGSKFRKKKNKKIFEKANENYIKEIIALKSKILSGDSSIQNIRNLFALEKLRLANLISGYNNQDFSTDIYKAYNTLHVNEVLFKDLKLLETVIPRIYQSIGAVLKDDFKNQRETFYKYLCNGNKILGTKQNNNIANKNTISVSDDEDIKNSFGAHNYFRKKKFIQLSKYSWIGQAAIMIGYYGSLTSKKQNNNYNNWINKYTTSQSRRQWLTKSNNVYFSSPKQFYNDNKTQINIAIFISTIISISMLYILNLYKKEISSMVTHKIINKFPILKKKGNSVPIIKKVTISLTAIIFGIILILLMLGFLIYRKKRRNTKNN